MVDATQLAALISESANLEEVAQKLNSYVRFHVQRLCTHSKTAKWETISTWAQTYEEARDSIEPWKDYMYRIVEVHDVSDKIKTKVVLV